MLDDFIEEEKWEEALQHSQDKGGEDDENIVLIGMTKGKSKKGSSGWTTSKKDMSKVKWFSCHNIGHYTSQCPNKNKGKKDAQVVASIEDDFVVRFEKELSLMSCLLGSGSAMYEDIGDFIKDSGSYTTWQ